MQTPITFPGLGIELNPSPIAFSVFGKDIYWYGVIIALGFLAAYLVALRKAKKFGFTEDDILDMVFWAIPAGVIGARLYYCIFYWDLYRDDPISCLYIWEGGLAIYGGVIAGALGLMLFSKLKKRPLGVTLDLAAFGVIIGQIFGRWGNFFNREAHGSETDSLFRMGLYEGGAVRYFHPTFLYESVWNLIGLVLMHLISRRRKFDGEIALFYLAWYGLGRMWVEGLRTDSLYLFGTGIRVSQLVAALCLLVFGGLLGYILLIKKPDGSQLYVNKKQG